MQLRRSAGHRLMLALPGVTAWEWHLQWEYWSPELAYCSAMLLPHFQLPITTLYILILWGHIAIEGKKTELLQRILWTKWSLVIDRAQETWPKWGVCAQFAALLVGIPAAACRSPFSLYRCVLLAHRYLLEKCFCCLVNAFLQALFEFKTYTVLKSQLYLLGCSFLLSIYPVHVLMGKHSRCDFFHLISLCSNWSLLKARLLIIITISYFWPRRYSTYYTRQLIIECFNAQLM